MYDSAAQALAKIALAPEWEAKVEPNSDGFRPGRSCHDAIEAIHASINQQDQDVLDADIAKCFDRIDHLALLAKLNTFPALSRTIHRWLKAGVMEGAQLFPTEAGAPHGGVLSPLLANVALHGLETAIETTFPTYKDRQRWKPKIVRFADDGMVLHKNRQVIMPAQEIATTWLQRLGLALQPSTTRIAHTRHPVEGVVGFDFLGFHVRQDPVGKYNTGATGQGKPLGFKTHITPSKAAQRTQLQQLKGEISKLRAAPQAALISRLHPLIRGWSHYDSTVVAKATFSRMDTLGFATLRRWAQRRHPHKSAWWVRENYWHPREGQWTFKTGKGNTLRRHAATPIRRHTQVTGARSPYDGAWIYWATSMGRHPETPRRWAYLLKRQQGRCHWCGLYCIPGEDLVELDHIQPRSQGGNGMYFNLQLLHRHCHADNTARQQTG